MENWRCPVDIPAARSWVCTACGRGRWPLAVQDDGENEEA